MIDPLYVVLFAHSWSSATTVTRPMSESEADQEIARLQQDPSLRHAKKLLLSDIKQPEAKDE